MDNRVELRWLCNKVKPSKGMTHKTMKLQYREFVDHNGPYPNYYWTDWKDVPEVWENEIEKS